MKIIGMMGMIFLVSCSTINKLNPWADEPAEVEAKEAENNAESSENASESKDKIAANNEAAESSDGGSRKEESKEVKATKEEKSAKHERKKSKAASVEELEKNQAELWAKLDGMKMQISEQSQRMKVLEKAVVLGIVPDELRNDAKVDRLSSDKVSKSNQKQGVYIDSHKSLEDKKSDKVSDTKSDANKKSITGDGRLLFEQKMASAQEFFRAGRYGRAIAEYSSVQKEFKEFDSQGSSSFWLAMSWLNMKEYQSAQKSFESFMQEYSNSPLIPRASFYLARAEYLLGFREKSQNRLRKIVADAPDDDAAEMARLELQQMKANL